MEHLMNQFILMGITALVLYSMALLAPSPLPLTIELGAPLNE